MLVRTDSLKSTIDHKPTFKTERARIEKYGSFITEDFGVGRVNGILAVSRAIGDRQFKTSGVISDPDIQQIESDPLYILTACDGVFDVLSN